MRVSVGHRDVSSFSNGVHVIHLISSNVLITNIVFSNEALKHNAIHPRYRCRTLTLVLVSSLGLRQHETKYSGLLGPRGDISTKVFGLSFKMTAKNYIFIYRIYYMYTPM